MRGAATAQAECGVSLKTGSGTAGPVVPESQKQQELVRQLSSQSKLRKQSPGGGVQHRESGQ